jgi:hypothetical protein
MVMREGQYTKTIYNLIKERQFSKAIENLEPIIQVLIFCRNQP